MPCTNNIKHLAYAYSLSVGFTSWLAPHTCTKTLLATPLWVYMGLSVTTKFVIFTIGSQLIGTTTAKKETQLYQWMVCFLLSTSVKGIVVANVIRIPYCLNGLTPDCLQYQGEVICGSKTEKYFCQCIIANWKHHHLVWYTERIIYHYCVK